MKTPLDTRLLTEASRFALRFACEDCVHFAPERERTCAHGWPVRLHRSAIDAHSTPNADEPVLFCKDFELA